MPIVKLVFKLVKLMNSIFSQIVFVIGKIEPQAVVMLGTGFLVSNNGLIATTNHIIGQSSANLVILFPNVKDINDYQDLSTTVCQPISCVVSEIDPFRDIAILKSDIKYEGKLPDLSGFDKTAVGDEVSIFGFPHCIEGRRALTYQKAEIGAKVKVEVDGIQSKQAVVNTQARPGQSGSMVFSPSNQTIVGLLLGAFAPNHAGISLGGINPRELHQTTHCVSAEYIAEML